MVPESPMWGNSHVGLFLCRVASDNWAFLTYSAADYDGRERKESMTEEKDPVLEALESKIPDDPDKEEGDKKTSTPDEGPNLEAQLKEMKTAHVELDKKFKGQFEALKAERGQRQDLQGKFDDLSTLLKGEVERRKSSDKEETVSGIPVDIDDEGNATISKDILAELIDSKNKPLEEKIGEVETATSERDNRTTQESAAQKELAGILAEDDAFPQAHAQLTRIVSWIDERLLPKLEEEGYKTVPTPGQILDILDGSSIETEFSKQFPDVELEKIVRSYDSKRDLRSALKHVGVSKTDDKNEKADMDSLKKIADKGSNLSGVQNQKDTRGMTLDKIASIDTEDILNASDDAVAEMLKIMEKAENEE